MQGWDGVCKEGEGACKGEWVCKSTGRGVQEGREVCKDGRGRQCVKEGSGCARMGVGVQGGGGSV